MISYPYPTRAIGPYAQFGIVRKPSMFAPCFAAADASNQAVVCKAGTQFVFNNRLITVDGDTLIPIDTGSLASATDYAIYVTSYGTLIFSANFTAPTGYSTANSLLVGGFHFAPGGIGQVVAAVGYGDGTNLSIGSNTKVASTAFYFSIGVTTAALTLKAAVAAGTSLPTQTVPANTWALYLLSIIANGTITVTPAAANATTGYASEALAIAALPALPANSASMGYVTVQTAAGQTFVAGTDALAGGTGGHVATTTNYYPQSSTFPQINPYTIWDLKFRPKCQDPRGMFLDLDGYWKDIYLCGTNTDVDGTSKYGAQIADGSSPPKIPAAFGGNGSTTYSGAFTRYNAAEVGAAYGKQLMSATEFECGAFGIQEATSLQFDPVIVRGSGPRTSQRGMMQSAGEMYVWGREMSFIPHTTALTGAPPADADENTWINATMAASWKAAGRGQAYTYGSNGLAAALLGGTWSAGSYAGSRCSNWNTAPWLSANSFIGARFRSDHLCLP